MQAPNERANILENFRIFCTDRAYDVIIFKFRGGGGLGVRFESYARER